MIGHLSPCINIFDKLKLHSLQADLDHFSFIASLWWGIDDISFSWKKGKRKVQGVPQSQTAALPRPQEEEETDKSKQARTERTYEKHQD